MITPEQYLKTFPLTVNILVGVNNNPKRLASKLDSSRLPDATKAATMTLVKEFLAEKWDQLRFFTFAENEAFLNFIVDRAVSGVLSRQMLHTLLCCGCTIGCKTTSI
jgi:hypothetical protein